jgi:AcrR family transcriptional regulator
MAQVKKPEVRDAIVSSAYELFRDKSYLRTSVAEIARKAGIVPSHIYVYFASKLAIFYAVYEPWLNKRLTRLERQLSKIEDPDQRQIRIIEAFWIRLPTEDNGFANNLMQAVSTADPDEPYRSDLLSRSEKTLSQLLRRALPDNRMSDADCDRDPYAISHLGWGLNPQARWYSLAMNGDEPERHRASARVFAGNFLFSTGPNSQGGGKRTTRGHYDVPMRDCTVMLDNEVIIDKGRVIDPKMRVARLSVA